jgi:hypothetical protein
MENKDFFLDNNMKAPSQSAWDVFLSSGAPLRVVSLTIRFNFSLFFFIGHGGWCLHGDFLPLLLSLSNSLP